MAAAGVAAVETKVASTVDERVAMGAAWVGVEVVEAAKRMERHTDLRQEPQSIPGSLHTCHRSPPHKLHNARLPGLHDDTTCSGCELRTRNMF